MLQLFIELSAYRYSSFSFYFYLQFVTCFKLPEPSRQSNAEVIRRILVPDYFLQYACVEHSELLTTILSQQSSNSCKAVFSSRKNFVTL
jgi:hypothetical protein